MLLDLEPGYSTFNIGYAAGTGAVRAAQVRAVFPRRSGSVDPSQLYITISCHLIVLRCSEISYVIYVHIFTIVTLFQTIFVLCPTKPTATFRLTK